MSISPSSERRHYLRVIPDQQHPIRVDINGANFIDVLHAIDISQGGLGMQVSHGFNGCDLEDRVSFVIDIPLPRHALVHCSGRIKHVSGNRFGVRFDPLPESVSAHIRAYIAVHVKQESWWMWFQYKLGLIK